MQIDIACRAAVPKKRMVIISCGRTPAVADLLIAANPISVRPSESAGVQIDITCRAAVPKKRMVIISCGRTVAVADLLIAADPISVRRK